MEHSVFKFVLRYSKKQQLILTMMTLLSFPFLYVSLDLPKTIINEAIGGSNFPRELFGFEFDQIEYLFLLCTAFLLFVLINGGFKYWINVYKGLTGERMLRRLRFMLYSRILRFPLPHFRKTSQGGLIAMITAEVEPMGGFIGDAFSLPFFQGGTLLTIIIFMFMQDWKLGIAATVLYPLQMWLIPKMQRQVNILAKERVRTVRNLSERISETVSGIEEIHANDTSEMELADFSSRVGRIYGIRYEIYKRKFLIKFLNNFIAQLTPFLFFSIGGYLVIQGELTFGSLVAVLAAYKDLSAPWKELLRYYQQKEDIRIKYEQLIEQFQIPGMLEEKFQRDPQENINPLVGAFGVTNLTLEEEGGIRVIEGATFNFDTKDSTAIIATDGGSAGGLTRLLSRLVVPTSGAIRVDGQPLATMHESITGQRLAYVGDSSYLFVGSILDNLLYGLKHQPQGEREYDDAGKEARSHHISEAEQSGNSTFDINADWVDMKSAGVSSPSELIDRTLDVLKVIELDEDIYEFGLLGTIDPAKDNDLTDKILETRGVLREKLKDPALAKLIEPFDRSKYNLNMTVAENLLFGTPIGDTFILERLGEDAYVLGVLDKVGLTSEFLETGAKLGGIMVELFQDLPPGHEFFERYSFITADDLPEYQKVCRRVEQGGVDELDETDIRMLMSLPFKLIPARHSLGLLDEGMQRRILEARRVFAEDLPDHLKGAVAFFDESKYNAAASIQDNILFGKLVYGRPQGRREIGAVISELIQSMGLYRTIMEVGLEMPVGIGGGRLSVGQRQKLAIGRGLLKRPDLLIINAATAALDPASQKSIMDKVFDDVGERGLIWALSNVDKDMRFKNAVVLEDGKVAGHGRFEDMTGSGQLPDNSTAA